MSTAHGDSQGGGGEGAAWRRRPLSGDVRDEKEPPCKGLGSGGRVWIREWNEREVFPQPLPESGAAPSRSLLLSAWPPTNHWTALSRSSWPQIAQTLPVDKVRPYTGPAWPLPSAMRSTDEETEAEHGECHPRSHTAGCPSPSSGPCPSPPAPPPSPEGSAWRTPWGAAGVGSGGEGGSPAPAHI